jgi:lysozyme family protein
VGAATCYPSNVALSQYDPVFLTAVEHLLGDEGGYADSKSDPGGETRFGISKREYPDLDIAHLTREQAIAIYWRDWWRRFGYDALPSPLSAKMLDLAVNIGPREAARCLQRALRACDLKVEETGILGAATRTAVAKADQRVLRAALRSEAAGHYRLIAASKRATESGRDFLDGWLNRAYA